MISFDNFIYHKSQLPEDSREQEEFYNELKLKFIEEINNSEKAQAYFKQFRSYHIDSFIKSYVENKILLTRYYESYNYLFLEHEEYELGFHKKAELALHAILQKKLFNMQILWRAEQLQIDEIDICIDFHFWGKYIASCPFIPPIEEHEKDLMKEYLLTSNEYDEDITEKYYTQWQDYEELMEKSEDGLLENMSDWYEFYDGRMGTGSFHILQNIRGDKEEVYMNINREILRSLRTEKFEMVVDERPSLSGYGESITDFAKIFETDKHYLQLYKGYEMNYKKESEYPYPEDIENAIEILSLADRPIHLLSHLNWKEALISAAKTYNNKKIVEALDIVFIEYKMLCELGMTTAKSKSEIKEAYEKDEIVKVYRTSILNGRVKNGEPEDFNF